LNKPNPFVDNESLKVRIHYRSYIFIVTKSEMTE